MNNAAPVPDCLVLYCRAGFEGECASEIQEHAAELGYSGYCKAKPDSGYVVFVPHEPQHSAALASLIPFHALIFARQLFAANLINGLPVDDRITPLLDHLAGIAVSEVMVETADTNEAKELLSFCRKFSTPFLQAVRRHELLREQDESAPRLHLFFLSSTAVYLGFSDPDNSSPWLMGIPRLRFPSSAPSRSTLKLDEAIHLFLSEEEQSVRLRTGMKAVDLGASPGGWTWQLVQRHLLVIAVDNGPMDQALLDSGLVQHKREDGFRFRPQEPVDWMVCDMVEQPGRIAHLVGKWVAEGWCRETIFNLKLPMKKRYQEVLRCASIIHELLESAGVDYEIAFKQLYHDREEVTGYLRRLN